MRKQHDNGSEQVRVRDHSFARTNPTTTKRMVDGGVITQYDQKIVRLISRSKASPDAACVIWASVSAGGDAISSTFDTTKTGLRENQ